MHDVTKMTFFHHLCELPFVEKIILFGSRARQTHRNRSDIDLAVQCPSATRDDWLKVVDIVEKADTLLKIDCVRLDDLSKSNLFRQQIEVDGQIIYEKK